MRAASTHLVGPSAVNKTPAIINARGAVPPWAIEIAVGAPLSSRWSNSFDAFVPGECWKEVFLSGGATSRFQAFRAKP